jgi:hypothetical protein
MRRIGSLPFVLAAVLFLLAWLPGFPKRAQSASLTDMPKGLKMRTMLLEDLPNLIKRD